MSMTWKGQTAVNCLLYANDSALLVNGRSVEEIEASLSLELVSVRIWLTDNIVTLDLRNTDSVLFESPKRIKKRSCYENFLW